MVKDKTPLVNTDDIDKQLDDAILHSRGGDVVANINEDLLKQSLHQLIQEREKKALLKGAEYGIDAVQSGLDKLVVMFNLAKELSK